ncbi:MAG: sigma 54-interacting transcriptional regulator [Bacillota bacterium]
MVPTTFSKDVLANLVSFVLDINPTRWGDSETSHCPLTAKEEIPLRMGLNPEDVRNSWVRSKSDGIKPNLPVLDNSLRVRDVKRLYKKNNLLLEAARPLFEQYFTFFNDTNKYAVALHDPNGIILHSSNSKLINLNYSEGKVGTTSHSLCANLNQLVCLVSPENFNRELRRAVFALSIPIRCEEGNVIGVLAFPYYECINDTLEEKELFAWLFSGLFLFVKAVEEKLCCLNFYISNNTLGKGISKPHFTSTRDGFSALYDFSDIRGQSPAINDTKKIVSKIAPQGGNVLLLGESGTGKELFAHSIHQNHRPSGPFVVLNCASIPENLIESELFGYEGGSFTGAKKSGNLGKLEIAHGGTLFLDEIGDMPLKSQPSLLRVLEEKRIMKIGGREYIPADFRVIAASNKNLVSLIKEQRFREDLYYRLANFEITIPPLRERDMDILELAEYFLQRLCFKTNRAVPVFDDKVKERLLHFDWPGNIRQLQNVIFYALNMSTSGRIKHEDLPPSLMGEETEKKPVKMIRSLKEIERDAISRALIFTNNDIVKAAEILGTSKTTLYRRLKEYQAHV